MPLEDTKTDVKLKLAALWASLMFLYIYVDYLSLYKPGFMESVIAGRVWKFEITGAFLLGALISVTIPAIMIFLSVALPAQLNRRTNLVIAVIYIPYTLFNLTGEGLGFLTLGATLEVILLLLVMLHAWKWPQINAHDKTRLET